MRGENGPPAKVRKGELDSISEVVSDNDSEDEVFIDEHNAKNVSEDIPNKTCIDCEKMYFSDKKDERKRKCKLCKSNEHGCLMEAPQKKSKGDIWLCGECLQLTTKVENHPTLLFDLKESLKKTATKRKRSTEEDPESKMSKRKTSTNNKTKQNVNPTYDI